MIQIEKIQINHIPALQIAAAQSFNEPLPTVIYYHGFNGEKESSLTIAYKIAEKGFRVILPDSLLHGERVGNATQLEIDFSFWDIVLQTITELAEIKDYLETKKLVIPERIGIGGTSMGGMTTYGALSKYDWIKSAAVLMGTPYISKRVQKTVREHNRTNGTKVTKNKAETVMERVSPYDITLHPRRLQERALFIWHGEKDEIISVEESRSFYETVYEQYENKNRVKFIEEKDRIHNISKLSIQKTAEWFEHHL